MPPLAVAAAVTGCRGGCSHPGHASGDLQATNRLSRGVREQWAGEASDRAGSVVLNGLFNAAACLAAYLPVHVNLGGGSQ